MSPFRARNGGRISECWARRWYSSGAESVFDHFFMKVGVRGCEEANIHFPDVFAPATHRQHFGFLHRSQQPALHLLRHVSDLVQKQIASVRLNNFSNLRAHSAREGAFDMPEQRRGV